MYKCVYIAMQSHCSLENLLYASIGFHLEVLDNYSLFFLNYYDGKKSLLLVT